MGNFMFYGILFWVLECFYKFTNIIVATVTADLIFNFIVIKYLHNIEFSRASYASMNHIAKLENKYIWNLFEIFRTHKS